MVIALPANEFASSSRSGKINLLSGMQKFGSFGEAISSLKVVKVFWRLKRRDRIGLVKIPLAF